VRRLIVDRLLQTVVVVLAVATIAFLLIHLAPGDPFTGSIEDPHVTAAVRAAWRHQWGYDRPLGEQYIRYLLSVARGDLGFSHVYQRWVRDVLADTLPRTLLIMGLALAASFAAGIGLGLFQARHHGRVADQTFGALALTLYSVPDFWLASLVLILFAQHLGLFPAGGLEDVLAPQLPLGARIADRVWHLVLPVGTLALLSAAGIARYQRAAILDVAGQDFVRTARAKGVDERRVLWHHILRNALLPVITLLGLAFPTLLGGTFFVEYIFSIPGMGSTALAAIGARDYSLVLAAVILGAAMVSLGNLLADLLAAAVDPRLRRQ
jgi:peptide/nickel transport system permease protein